MAKYNAVKHTIEADDGQPLASLDRGVTGAEGFTIADWWGGRNNEMENLRGELSNVESDLNRARDGENFALREMMKVEDKLYTAEQHIKELEADLTEKGAAV
jgi:hypothetical protein